MQTGSGKESIDVSPMLHTNKPAKDQHGNLIWYPEPFYEAATKDGSEINGTFRAVGCSRIVEKGTFNVKEMCRKCYDISNSLSFKRRAERLAKRTKSVDPTFGLRYEDMNFQELLNRSRTFLHENERLKDEVFLRSSEITRLKVRRDDLKSKIVQLAGEGDFSKVGVKLVQAHRSGFLKDKTIFKDCLKSAANNFFVKGKQGKRYKGSLMDFYLGCLLMGGPRLADFVAANLFGPHIDTILKVRSERRIQLCLGCSPKNFQNAAAIYSKIMPTLNCDAVPSLAAEDETACIQEARWVNMGHLRDTILGFCGEKSPHHKCCEDVHVVVGNDPGAYERIKEAFDKNVVSSMIRVMMINPLHPLLPPLVVLAMPTCNKFDHFDIQKQWSSAERLYDQYLKPVLK